MSANRWLFTILLLSISACGGNAQPKLELDGHWDVDQNLDEHCKVTASFYDNKGMALSFYSLTEGACQTERYGVEGDAVMIDIISKKDYFDSDGALAAELQVFVHDLMLNATIHLRETAAGMDAVIVELEENSLALPDSLFNREFTMNATPTDWFDSLRGNWGYGCDDTDSSECQVLEFRSEMVAQARTYTNCDADLQCLEEGYPADIFYTLRNSEKLSDGSYKIDLVIFGARSDDGPAGRSITFVLSDDRLELIGSDTFSRLEKLPTISLKTP